MWSQSHFIRHNGHQFDFYSPGEYILSSIEVEEITVADVVIRLEPHSAGITSLTAVSSILSMQHKY